MVDETVVTVINSQAICIVNNGGWCDQFYIALRPMRLPVHNKQQVYRDGASC